MHSMISSLISPTVRRRRQHRPRHFLSLVSLSSPVQTPLASCLHSPPTDRKRPKTAEVPKGPQLWELRKTHVLHQVCSYLQHRVSLSMAISKMAQFLCSRKLCSTGILGNGKLEATEYTVVASRATRPDRRPVSGVPSLG